MNRCCVKRKQKHNERGSLALEQILIIAAIVTMSAGLFVFYDNVSTYFRTFNLSSLPTTVSASSNGTSGAGSTNTP